jgi:hypothetical protein
MSMTFEHRVTTPTRGDFLIDEKYLFEVGGKNKGFKQIKDIPNSFVVWVFVLEIFKQQNYPFYFSQS